MRRMITGLLAIGFGMQGCGSPARNSASSDPGSNAANDLTSTMTNEPEPANVQSNASDQSAGRPGGSRCGEPLRSCLGTDGQAPVPDAGPPAVAVTPQAR